MLAKNIYPVYRMYVYVYMYNITYTQCEQWPSFTLFCQFFWEEQTKS